MGILEVLTIIFVICKLTGVIAWSWWLVLSPELIAVGLYIIALVFWGSIGIFGYKKAKKKFKDFDEEFFNDMR